MGLHARFLPFSQIVRNACFAQTAFAASDRYLMRTAPVEWFSFSCADACGKHARHCSSDGIFWWWTFTAKKHILLVSRLLCARYIRSSIKAIPRLYARFLRLDVAGRSPCALSFVLRRSWPTARQRNACPSYIMCARLRQPCIFDSIYPRHTSSTIHHDAGRRRRILCRGWSN